MKINKQTIIVILSLFICLALGIFGFSYAYFRTIIAGTGQQNILVSGDLVLDFYDETSVSLEDIFPGDTLTKTFAVSNGSSKKLYYAIDWEEYTNTFTNDEIHISMTCTSYIDYGDPSQAVSGTCEGLDEIEATDDIIKEGIPINAGITHEYTVTVTFIELSESQNYNKGKNFNGVLKIVESSEMFTMMGTLLDTNSNPIGGATIELHSTLRTGITDENGKFEIRVEVGIHEVTIKNSSDVTIATDTISLLSGEAESINGKEITGNTNEGKVGIKIKLGASSINTISLVEWYEKCTASDTNIGCKIFTDNIIYRDDVSSTYVTASTGVNFVAKSTHTNGQGLYTNNKLEDGKNLYFRGGSFCAYPSYESETSGTYCTAVGGTWTNNKCSLDLNRTSCQSKGYTYYDLKNNITFAGHKWRIIRIDENSNVRMILADDSVSTTKFNNLNSDNAYIGYMYGDESLFIETISSSTKMLGMLGSAYYYSTSYSSNESKRFYLTGTMVSGQWNTESICTSTSCPVANYYTCLSGISGTCTTLYKIASWYNSSLSNSYTVQYSSTSYELAHQNLTNSIVKTAVDSWYSSNLLSYSSYLADAGYCNDRSLSSGSGYGTNSTSYGPDERNAYSAANPRLSITSGCPIATRDLFTTSGSSIGNKLLTYPIGLITGDEAKYAGTVYCQTTANYNFTNYLKFNSGHHTMSGSSFNSSTSYYFDIGSYGCFTSYGTNKTNGIRPSISLKPTVTVSSGTGKYDDPYVIE